MRKHKPDSIIKWISITAIGNIISAALITIAAFVFFDYFYKTPRVDGFWEYDLRISESLDSSQRNQILTYHVILRQDELNVTGSGDLHSTTGSRKLNLPSEKGERVRIEGHIEKNFFSPHKLYLAITSGQKEDHQTTFHNLVFKESATLEGTFNSTRDSMFGTASWRKGKKYYQLNLKRLPLN